MRGKAGTVRWLVGLVACLALVLPPAAGAAEAPEEIHPTVPTGLEVFGGFPGPLSLGPDGALWFTNGKDLGRIDAGGAFSKTPLSTDITPPRFQSVGAEGDLWATSAHEVDRITGSGQVTRFPLPEADGEIGPIAAAPDGTLWVTAWVREQGHERSFGKASVLRLSPDGGITPFPLPGPAGEREVAPASIVAGPDGNVWFTDPGLGRFGRFTPGGELTEFQNRLHPEILSPDGAGGLWFVGEKGVGTIDPSGNVREIRVDDYEAEVGFGTDAVTGPEGDLWFIAAATQVLRMAPSGQLSWLRPPGRATSRSAPADRSGSARGKTRSKACPKRHSCATGPVSRGSKSSRRSSPCEAGRPRSRSPAAARRARAPARSR